MHGRTIMGDVDRRGKMIPPFDKQTFGCTGVDIGIDIA